MGMIQWTKRRRPVMSRRRHNAMQPHLRTVWCAHNCWSAWRFRSPCPFRCQRQIETLVFSFDDSSQIDSPMELVKVLALISHENKQTSQCSCTCQDPAGDCDLGMTKGCQSLRRVGHLMSRLLLRLLHVAKLLLPAFVTSEPRLRKQCRLSLGTWPRARSPMSFSV